VLALQYLQDHNGSLPQDKSEQLITAIATSLHIPNDRVRIISTLDTKDMRRALNVRPTKLDLGKEGDILPTTGWLSLYMLLSQGGESPIGYAFWAGVAVIASIARRNIYWDMGKYFLYLNHYLLITGESGLKKTTAADIGLSLLNLVNEYLERGEPHDAPIRNQVFVAPKRVTPERLVQMMSRLKGVDVGHFLRTGQVQTTQIDAAGYIQADELVTMLGQNVKGSDRMVHFLTAVYGCPAKYMASTVTRSDEVLLNVALTLFFATTLEWARTSITEDMFAGGFLARFITVHRDTPNAVVPIASPIDPVLQSELARYLLPWATLLHPIELKHSPEAMEWYDRWYRRSKETNHEPRLDPYWSRRHDHLHKLAGILCLSDMIGPDTTPDTVTHGSGVIEVPAHYLQRAYIILRREEAGQAIVYREIGSSQESRNTQLVLQQLILLRSKLGRPVMRSELLRSTRYRIGSAFRLDQCIDTLLAEGRVRRATTPTNATVYDPTPTTDLTD